MRAIDRNRAMTMYFSNYFKLLRVVFNFSRETLPKFQKQTWPKSAGTTKQLESADTLFLKSLLPRKSVGLLANCEGLTYFEEIMDYLTSLTFTKMLQKVEFDAKTVFLFIIITQLADFLWEMYLTYRQVRTKRIQTGFPTLR